MPLDDIINVDSNLIAHELSDSGLENEFSEAILRNHLSDTTETSDEAKMKKMTRLLKRYRTLRVPNFKIMKNHVIKKNPSYLIVLKD
uniref:Uncharacterized protein n=1 Tax=Rhabditophanes sp. KR3021 TaxID=114890 RepID=A0AC35UHC0_9BILA